MAALLDLSNIITFLIVGIVLVTIYVQYCYGYWKRRKVPFLEPRFPYGNSDSLFPKGIFIGLLSKKLYDEFKKKGHQMIGGVYIGIQPFIVMLSPDWIKDVLIKDFQSFSDRGFYMNENEPLSVHLFSQPVKQWKSTRLKFTPVFTSAKIKAMFETMLTCTKGLNSELSKLEAQKSDVEALEVAASFTTDVIGSCAFGIDCNSFADPDSELRKVGRDFSTKFTLMDRVNIFLTIFAPKLALMLGASNIQKEISLFFTRNITHTVKCRESSGQRRNDVLQLLIDMKNSEIKLGMNELIGQVFLFFMAGLETSSIATGMALFEISKDEDVQNRVREEILSVLEKYDNKITYDAIAEMKYLGQVVDETLRLWPPLVTIIRLCTKDYKFENSDIIIEKGTPILIPALGLHHDPEFWPDPLKWDPDRFSDENKVNIRPFTYLPFGEGPRNCIGLRFGLLQTKLALVTVLSQYKVTLSPSTIMPVGINPDSFLTLPKNDVYLRLEKI